jgi:transcriptional regulator with XRE-family HTH domain
MGGTRKPDVMVRIRRIFENSGLSLDELGKRMGYSSALARKSAWQFLNKTSDPRLSMIQRFADALSMSLVDVIK